MIEDLKLILIIHGLILLTIMTYIYINSRNQENLVNLPAQYKDKYKVYDCSENLDTSKNMLKAFYKEMYTNEEYNKIREKIDGESVEDIMQRYKKMIRFYKLEDIRKKDDYAEFDENTTNIKNQVISKMEKIGMDKFLDTVTMTSDAKNSIKKLNKMKNVNERREYLNKLGADVKEIIDLGSIIPEGEENNYTDTILKVPVVTLE
jgi:hypothetical protein